ncbi:hypothetical protein [Mycobacterium marinum]|uniref:hypothetical protein n=1 Tax=Mycobacterium marinum TaxID=1781 RepID=UPI003565ADFB
MTTKSPDPPTATTDGEATTIAPPPTVVASELAWSLDDDSTAATTTPRSWRSVWTVAGLGVLGAAAAAGVIAAIGVGKDTGSVQGAPGPDTTEETALLPPPAGWRSIPAISAGYSDGHADTPADDHCRGKPTTSTQRAHRHLYSLPRRA